MSIATKKIELIKWISSIEDKSIVDQLDRYRKQNAFDFDKEIENAISAETLKKRTNDFLQSLEWKK